MPASYDDEGTPVIVIPTVAWAIDPATVAGVRRHRDQFGLTGLYAELYFEPSPYALGWGIVVVGNAGEALRGYPVSAAYNPRIVATFLDEQDRVQFCHRTLAADDDDRREGLLGGGLLISNMLILAGPNLLNCCADDVTTDQFCHEIRASLAEIESGRSYWEREAVRLLGVLHAASCGNRKEAA